MTKDVSCGGDDEFGDEVRVLKHKARPLPQNGHGRMSQLCTISCIDPLYVDAACNQTRPQSMGVAGTLVLINLLTWVDWQVPFSDTTVLE